MKKYLLIILGIIILSPNALAIDADLTDTDGDGMSDKFEMENKLDKDNPFDAIRDDNLNKYYNDVRNNVNKVNCQRAWSAAFDKADLELTDTLEQFSKSNKNTSELVSSLPNIIRIYRRQLLYICKAAELKTNVTTSLITNSDITIKILEAGNEEMKISEIENRFGSLNYCAISTGEDYNLIELWLACRMHADFKLQVLQSTLPAIARKSSNRKQMGFLAYKLTDLTQRLNTFIFDSLTPFTNKLTKIVDNLQCVAPHCD